MRQKRGDKETFLLFYAPCRVIHVIVITAIIGRLFRLRRCRLLRLAAPFCGKNNAMKRVHVAVDEALACVLCRSLQSQSIQPCR